MIKLDELLTTTQVARDAIFSHNKNKNMGYPLFSVKAENGYQLLDKNGKIPYRKTVFKSSKWLEFIQFLIAQRAIDFKQNKKYKNDSFIPVAPHLPNERSIVRVTKAEYDHFCMPVELRDHEGKLTTFKKAERVCNKTEEKNHFKFYKKCVREAKKAMDYGLSKERCILFEEYKQEQTSDRKVTDHIIIERMAPKRCGKDTFLYRIHLPNWMYLPAINEELSKKQDWFGELYGEKVNIMRVPCHQIFGFELTKRFCCLTYEKFLQAHPVTQQYILRLSEVLYLGLERDNPKSFNIFNGDLDTSIPYVMAMYAIYFNSYRQDTYYSTKMDISDLINHVTPTLFETADSCGNTRFVKSAKTEEKRLRMFWGGFLANSSYDGVYPIDMRFPENRGGDQSKTKIPDKSVKFAFSGHRKHFDPKTGKLIPIDLKGYKFIYDHDGNIDFKLVDYDKHISIDEANPNK